MERGGRRGDVRAGTAHLVEGAEVLEDERATLQLSRKADLARKIDTY